METRIVDVETLAAAANPGPLTERGRLGCPRCEAFTVVILQKLGDHFNNCYQCRGCGHVFSPRS